MKSLIVRTNFIGGNPKEVRVNINEDKSIKQLIDENYSELLPRPDLFDASMPDFVADWESLNEASLRYFNNCYRFLCVQLKNGEDSPIHLIDRIIHIKSDSIKLTPPRLMIDDSLAFFVIEKYGLNGKKAIPIDNHVTPDSLREFLERLLMTTDTQILIENYSQNQAEYKMGAFIEQIIPADLWLNLSNDEFSYYKKFIIRFANQVLILDYCLVHSTLKDNKILEDLSRGRIDNFLYKMQNLMLVLLSIPETFLRNACKNRADYVVLLQDKQIQKPPIRDDQYYLENIKNQSISSLYFKIFGDLTIHNYQEYMKFCEDTPLSDSDLGRIINTYRILFNKLKHASYVQIIKSRDEEEFKKKELEEIDGEIEQIKNIQKTDELVAALTQQELEMEEFLRDAKEKIRYAYAHLDFEDPEFKQNNGIWVVDEAGNKFSITLADMELSLKVLFGILCVLNRTN